ncbi:MAG: hypothetical protein RRY38_04580 [Oscillospiraceae bacterium]
MSAQKKTILLAICAALAVIAVAVIALWPSLPALFSPGAKTITVVVNSQDGPYRTCSSSRI